MRKPPGLRFVQPGNQHRIAPLDLHHGSAGMKIRPVQRHFASAIAQHRVAFPANVAAIHAIEAFRRAQQLRRKLPVLPRDLADHRLAQQRPLAGIAPVHQQRFDARAIKHARRDLLVRNVERRQRAVDIHRVGAQTQPVARLTRQEPAFRLKHSAIHHQPLVMIGIAGDRPVAPRHTPAMAQSRRRALEMRAKLLAHTHALTSIRGMEGICPALKAVRLMAMRSESKRTGT